MLICSLFETGSGFRIKRHQFITFFLSEILTYNRNEVKLFRLQLIDMTMYATRVWGNILYFSCSLINCRSRKINLNQT